jgi:hypothetical protein
LGFKNKEPIAQFSILAGKEADRIKANPPVGNGCKSGWGEILQVHWNVQIKRQNSQSDIFNP